jgi:type IV/VI secretion system ImpK/VasF family protein
MQSGLMRKEIADFVFPVIRAAIEYKEGLRTNESVWRFRFGECQKKMLALLLAPVPDPLRPDVLGDPRVDASAANIQIGFLGLRYALACWLDDIFILDSVWKEQWNANKMEYALYKLNKRNTEFWDQAQRSQTRPTRDALEVYYLCVMLGFRGKMSEKPIELNAWRDAVQTQITEPEEREYVAPQGLVVPPTVDKTLVGARQMQTWLKRLTIVGAIALAVGAALAVFIGDRLSKKTQSAPAIKKQHKQE